MAKFVSNAFSLSMLKSCGHSIVCLPMSLAEAKELAEDAKSYVVHEDTAKLFSGLLETTVVANRSKLTLEVGDGLIVGQYTGPRLEVGATSLPDGATVHWWLVIISGRS